MSDPSETANNADDAKKDAYPLLEVARHQTRRSCWMVIDSKVYDVTPFLDEHPGGEDILLDSAGRDATREFEDVGHSGAARAQLATLYKGELRAPTAEELAAAPEPELKSRADGGVLSAVMKWALPVLLIVLAYVIRKYAN